MNNIEKIREDFISDFPDMECATEKQTASLVADYWISIVLEAEKRAREEERNHVLSWAKTMLEDHTKEGVLALFNKYLKMSLPDQP